MFWGLVIEPSKKYTQKVSQTFHISQAALDLKSADQEPVQIVVEYENSNFILATLSKKANILQVPMDLIFKAGDQVSFRAIGNGKVHLSGYHILDDLDSVLLNEEDSDYEESEVENILKKRKKSKQKSKCNKKAKSDQVMEYESDALEQYLKKNSNKNKEKKSLAHINKQNNDDDDDDYDDTDDDDDDDQNDKDSKSDIDDNDDDTESNEIDNELEFEENDEDGKVANTEEGGDFDSEDDDDDDDDDDASLDGEDNDDNDTDDGYKDDDDDNDDSNDVGFNDKEKDGKNLKFDNNKTPNGIFIGTKGMGKMSQIQEENNKGTPLKKCKTPKNEKEDKLLVQGNTPKRKASTDVKIGEKTSKILKSNGSKEKRVLEGGITIEELKIGNGAIAKPGKMVNVYYIGSLQSTKKQFDSVQHGSGFKFVLGKNEVIKGWDIGINGMKVGGKRKIIVPPYLAYGTKGSPPAIPPNSTLIFTVELRSVS